MGPDKPQTLPESLEPPGQCLHSWKAIAAYLKRDESTMRRWEKEGLPVHRHLHTKKAAVYAYTSEIDLWWNKGRARLEAATTGRRRRLAWSLLACLIVSAAGAAWLAGGFGDRLVNRVPAGDITSIAVLPLANLSGDPQQDYFADGMTEALINELAMVSAVRVVSRTSVMAHKNTKKSLEQVARELNVDAIVEGALVRDAGRLRVSARLVRMGPERQVWAEQYDRELSSILVLQSELARAIAGEVGVKLASSAHGLRRAQAVNPEAYDAYIKGRYQWNQASGSALLKAREYFEEAIRKDPALAQAYPSLANTYTRAYSWGAPSLPPPRESFPKAKALVLEGLKLDETVAEAHASLAYIKQAYDYDWDGAEWEFRRALQLSPNDASLSHWYAMHLAKHGRFDEAFVQIRRAEELDPLSRAIKRGKGWIYLWSRDFDRAIAQWRMTLELDPDFPDAHYALAQPYTAKGMYEEAINSLLKAVGLSGGRPRSLAVLAYLHGKTGNNSAALQILGILEGRAEHEYVSGYVLALAYLGIADKEQALRWLEKAFEERDPWLAELKQSFWWDPLRSEPRFQKLLRRLRLAT